MSRIEDEKIKLVSAALNNAAGSCFTIGVAAPLFATLTNLGGIQNSAKNLSMLAILTGWLFAALILHLLAQRHLERLEP